LYGGFMDRKYNEFCKKNLKKELFNEGLDKLIDVELKIIPINIKKCSGYVIPNFENSEYKIIINAGSYFSMTEDDKYFYTYVTLCHEIEHIKTFEKTKDKNFNDFEHFISLLEYLTYLEKYNASFDNLSLGLKIKQLIAMELKRNYKVSTGELKSSLIGYKKAKNSELFKQHNANIDSIIKSLELLNNDMQLCYDCNGVSYDKFEYFFSKASVYIKKHPEILNVYKILTNFFNLNDGSAKNIYDIYLNINDNNKEFYSKYILNLLSISRPTKLFEEQIKDIGFRKYLEELINNYNDDVINYYRNIKLGSIFIDNEKILYENLKILLARMKKLNYIMMAYNLKRNSGIIM